MIEMVSVLQLKPQQMIQLLVHLTAYRSYLWRSVMPTPERNQIIRNIQTLQGQIEPLQAQGQENIPISMSKGESTTMRYVLKALIQYYGTMAASEQRNQALGEVTELRLLVERTFRSSQTR